MCKDYFKREYAKAKAELAKLRKKDKSNKRSKNNT